MCSVDRYFNSGRRRNCLRLPQEVTSSGGPTQTNGSRPRFIFIVRPQVPGPYRESTHHQVPPAAGPTSAGEFKIDIERAVSSSCNFSLVPQCLYRAWVPVFFQLTLSCSSGPKRKTLRTLAYLITGIHGMSSNLKSR